MSAVVYDTDAEIAILTIDYPPVNALSLAVRSELDVALSRAMEDEEVRAVIILGAGKTFIAGADITEFGTGKDKARPGIKDLQARLEGFPKLTVAAVHGTALGGGLELALACHARVAVASAKLGLPEVNLGLLPGAGGTQRLPRLTGVEAAIDIITSGRPVSAPEALKLGIIDAIIDDLRTGALAFARRSISEGTPFRSVIDCNERVTGVEPAVFEAAREKVRKKVRGKIAPMAIIDCIEAACTMPAPAGLAFERE